MQLGKAIQQIQQAAAREMAVGQEEVRQALFKAREKKDQSPDAPRFAQMKDAYRTPQAIKAALGGKEDPQYKAARDKAGIGFDFSGETRGERRNKRIGTILGALGADIVQDKGRQFYWLVNAAQATGDMIAEAAIARARPSKNSTSHFGKGYKGSDLYALDEKGKRRYGPGMVQLSAVPAGIAINTGLGLMTPFGGAEGYKAAVPSEDDPTKTANPVLEVGAKYIMGRTGNLLPYDQFSEARPDVSREEYGRYKAFKFDNDMDINPFDDGQVSLPMGAAKYTSEGIHGPEVQFLGRSLPVTTGIVPFLGAVAGGALGVSRLGPKTDEINTKNPVLRQLGSNKPIRRGFIGASAGLVAGNVVGNIIEAERRRRNTVENELDGTLS